MTSNPSLDRRTLLAGGLTLLAGGVVAGCADPGNAATRAAGSSSGAPRVTGAKNAAAAARLPAAVRERGSIVIGNAAGGGGTPPLAFLAEDNTTPTGVEVDLARLLAEILGLRVEQPVTSWENLFLKVDAGTFDAVLSNVTVTEERKAKYDFATYRKDDISVEAKKGATWRVRSGADIAGRTLAVGSGTNQEKILVDWNAANVKAGRPRATIRYYQNPADRYLALQSGQIDAYVGPSPNVRYHIDTAKQTVEIGRFSGGGSRQGLIGVLSKKGSGLAPAFAAAVDAAIADGSYRAVLDRWGVQADAVPRSLVNPPGLPKS